MTLEHLLMMRSGFFCDDSNPDAPGNEDKMLDQEDEPDYYRYTLRLPLDRDPGAKGVYCSIDPNLALGVLERATGQPVMESFDRLLGGPLKITTYAWPLSPAGQPYGGGGMQFLPRDFMKLGQLMLNGGTWQGRRILSDEFVARASAPSARTAFDQVRPALVEHRIPVQGPHRARLLRRWQRRPGRDRDPRARPGGRDTTAAITQTGSGCTCSRNSHPTRSCPPSASRVTMRTRR